MGKSSGFFYGWVVVAVGALMTCVAFGSMLSLAVFLQPISQDMGWSRSGVSAAATIDFLAMGLAAFFWGSLSDRFGTRIVVLSGTLLLGAGLIGASQATSLWQFQFFFGVLIGVAAGTAVTNASGVATLANVSLSGIAAGNYATGVSASFAGDASYSASSGGSALTVSQKPVTPSVTASNKTYDGTASATVTSCTLTGVIGGDLVTCAGSATFASATVGVGKTVTASGLMLSGAAAGNYSLSTTTATTTATVAARPVSPTVTVAASFGGLALRSMT